jgi:hypothetical protein
MIQINAISLSRFCRDPGVPSSSLKSVEGVMKRIFAASMTVAAVSFASPLEAVAQERVGDAALGALSGAVFFGPVGAVAGAMVGYTTGPSIAHAWGMQRHRPHHYARSKHPASHGTKKAHASTKASAQAARASTVRPVQALE